MKRKKITFEVDNLAFPEVRTGVCDSKENAEKNDEEKKEHIHYDNVAVPEIRTGRK